VNVLDLSRWQFGITTVYHFLFVPITIGMAFLVAGFEAAWLLARRSPSAGRWSRSSGPFDSGLCGGCALE
jgi:cytochrome bd-type quinol oxidase subunit 1